MHIILRFIDKNKTFKCRVLPFFNHFVVFDYIALSGISRFFFSCLPAHTVKREATALHGCHWRLFWPPVFLNNNFRGRVLFQMS